MHTITTSLTNKIQQNKDITIDNNTTICEAYGCSRLASITITLTAGTKDIIVCICDKCKSKFE